MPCGLEEVLIIKEFTVSNTIYQYRGPTIMSLSRLNPLLFPACGWSYQPILG